MELLQARKVAIEEGPDDDLFGEGSHGMRVDSAARCFDRCVCRRNDGEACPIGSVSFDAHEGLNLMDANAQVPVDRCGVGTYNLSEEVDRGTLSIGVNGEC